MAASTAKDQKRGRNGRFAGKRTRAKRPKGTAPKDAANQHLAELEEAIVRIEQELQYNREHKAPRTGVGEERIREIARSVALAVIPQPEIPPGRNDHVGVAEVQDRPAKVVRSTGDGERTPGLIEIAYKRLQGVLAVSEGTRHRVVDTSMRLHNRATDAAPTNGAEEAASEPVSDVERLFVLIRDIEDAVLGLDQNVTFLCKTL